MKMLEKRRLATPGDLLVEGDYIAGKNTYKEDGKIYSQRLGLVEFDGKKVSVVPLKGPYIPKVGDVVIGLVSDVSLNGWTVDINAPYKAVLSVMDVTGKSFSPKFETLTKILDIGEVVVGKIVAFDRTRDPTLSIRGPGLGKIEDGVIVNLTPTKVPRLIGKKGSMINMLKNETGCEIIVGQNGKILVKGRDPKKVNQVIKAIKIIEGEAHTTGLTDRIKVFLESEKKGEAD
ncbi:RNA-binding protein [Candidatus Bathyarchaeota archaeon]|nr:MAG: RNA-binding protein [Candidatus Bathyarchaeota archaeon]